jgi:hypothetical protein
MAAGAEDAAILVVGGVQEPPLDPVAGSPLVDHRSALERTGPFAGGAELRGLTRVVHQDRTERRGGDESERAKHFSNPLEADP